MSPAVTISEGQKSLEATLPELEARQGFENKRYPVRSNWASKLGHACERYLYYMRHDWEKAAPRDWKGIGILGNLLADYWVRDMSAKGLRIIHEQIALKDEIVKKYQIGGRIDCRIAVDGVRPLLTEIKTMDERYYDQINTYEDMADSRAEWIRTYPAQLQIYLLSEGDEAGLFVLINKKTLEWKAIPVYLDYAYCEWLLQRAERVNQANEKGIPPARIPYCKSCDRCDFKMTCLPDIINDGLPMVDDEHLEGVLNERKSLEDAVLRYKDLDDEAKGVAKKIGKDFIIGTSWKAEVKTSETVRIDTKAIPIEERAKYEKKSVMTRIEFVPLGKD